MDDSTFSYELLLISFSSFSGWQRVRQNTWQITFSRHKSVNDWDSCITGTVLILMYHSSLKWSEIVTILFEDKIFYIENSLITFTLNLIWTLRICKWYLVRASCSVSNACSREVVDDDCIETWTVLRHCNVQGCNICHRILRSGSRSFVLIRFEI